VVTTENNQEDEVVSWSAYHASLQPFNELSDSFVLNTSLLPLFTVKPTRYHDSPLNRCREESSGQSESKMPPLKIGVTFLNNVKYEKMQSALGGRMALALER